MMDHQAIRDDVFARYDGELTGESRRAVEAHLSDCADCRMARDQWTQLAGVFFQAPRVSTSEAFVVRVMQQVAAPRPQPIRLSRWWFEGGWLVPAMGLAAVLFVMAHGSRQPAISVESLLLSEREEPAAMQQVLSGERSSAEDVLRLLMEEEAL